MAESVSARTLRPYPFPDAASRIVLSRQAELDLDRLFEWISRDSSIERAEAIFRRIDETLDLIAAMPRIGRIRRDLDGEPRTFALWPWVIIYEPRSAAEGVIVWRILDGRRDLAAEIEPSASPQAD